MIQKTIFTSRKSYEDAEQKAKRNGFRIIGKSINKRSGYIVFGVRE